MNEIVKSVILTPFNILYKISPVFELKLLFKIKTGRKLDLSNPKSFNEKINWLKLYDTKESNSLKPYLCDKYEVRKYIRKKLGNDLILNELYWEGYNPEDIPFDKLPTQFVIKVTHGSTFNIICKNKDDLNRERTIKSLRRWLNAKFLPCYGEWWYGKIKPRIIIEKYLENEDKQELTDYKIFCFNGEPKFIDVHSGRFAEHKRNVYDTNWNYLKDVRFKYPNSEDIQKPNVLDDLLDYARKLSKDFVHVRVDFFIVNDNIYFSEFTFANGAGFDPISPYEFELEMGKMIHLPGKESKN